MSFVKKLGTGVMIIDSTVIIDFLNKQENARQFLLQGGTLGVSRVVVMEIFAGTRSHNERKIVSKQLQLFHASVIEISEDISELAGDIFAQHFHSHGIGIMDAFIAATALIHKEPLVTHNTKHFRFIKGLDLVVPY